jgi:hypothetical protein
MVKQYGIQVSNLSKSILEVEKIEHTETTTPKMPFDDVVGLQAKSLPNGTRDVVT